MNPFPLLKKYTLIASTNNFVAYDPVPKICRFCKKGVPEVTFETIPHVISELLGENDYTSLDECDSCNNKFSAYESHLSIFFRPYLTMVAVKGKRKIPEFHSRTVDGNENTRTIISAEEGKRKIYLSEMEDYKIDKENKTMSVTFRKPPHRPLWIYKALVKTGLSIMPKERIERYSNAFDWLLDKPADINYSPVGFITILTRSKFKKPYADLFEAKRTIYKKSYLPELTLVVGFGNIIIQVFLPSSMEFDPQTAAKKAIDYNLFPSFIYDKHSGKTKFKISPVMLHEENTVTYNETLHFSYQSVDFQPDEN